MLLVLIHVAAPLSADEPVFEHDIQPLLAAKCGKCHGPLYKDWRVGLHGKRIGEWASDGKKRWFVCTECHNPHDVQQGERNSGFAQIEPEAAPQLPKGLENADHEKVHH